MRTILLKKHEYRKMGSCILDDVGFSCIDLLANMGKNCWNHCVNLDNMENIKYNSKDVKQTHKIQSRERGVRTISFK